MLKIAPAITDQAPPEGALEVTNAAFDHLLNRVKQTEGALGIMLGVKKAGCSGLKYDVGLAMARPDDAFEFRFRETLSVYVPHESFPFLKGCRLDYIRQGINAQLKVINPNETGSCGCGESFAVKG